MTRFSILGQLGGRPILAADAFLGGQNRTREPSPEGTEGRIARPPSETGPLHDFPNGGPK
jgi:hypothetical protein